MQIVPFRAHCQSVCTNFDFSSFSRISCEVKAAVLHGKSVGFASQNSRFRNVKTQLLLFNRIIFTKLNLKTLIILLEKNAKKT